MVQMMGSSWLGGYRYENPEKQQEKPLQDGLFKFKYHLPSLVTPCPAKHQSPCQSCFCYDHEESDIAP